MNTQWKKRKKNWKLRLLWLWYRLRGLEAPMIHYINGTDVLPAPLTPEQEDEMLHPSVSQSSSLLPLHSSTSGPGACW